MSEQEKTISVTALQCALVLESLIERRKYYVNIVETVNMGAPLWEAAYMSIEQIDSILKSSKMPRLHYDQKGLRWS